MSSTNYAFTSADNESMKTPPLTFASFLFCAMIVPCAAHRAVAKGEAPQASSQPAIVAPKDNTLPGVPVSATDEHTRWQVSPAGAAVAVSEGTPSFAGLHLNVLRSGVVVKSVVIPSGTEPKSEQGKLYDAKTITIGGRNFVRVNIKEANGEQSYRYDIIYAFMGEEIRQVGWFDPRFAVVAVGDDWKRVRSVDPSFPKWYSFDGDTYVDDSLIAEDSDEDATADPQ